MGCLPAAESDAESGPPAPLNACRGRTSAGATPTVRFEAPFIINGATYNTWLTAGCAELDAPFEDTDDPQQVGSLRSVANCPADGDACVAEGIAVGTEDDPRTYSLRIQSPTGSVLGSRDLEIPISPSSLPLSPITLPQRVLVRGLVDVGESVCDDRDDSDGLRVARGRRDRRAPRDARRDADDGSGSVSAFRSPPSSTRPRYGAVPSCFRSIPACGS